MREVTCSSLECEMTRAATCPPPCPATESQQPESSPKPPKPLLVNSLSSHMMKITELPFHAREEVIAPTVLERNVSPVLIRLCSLLKLHGSAGVGPRAWASWGGGGAVDA